MVGLLMVFHMCKDIDTPEECCTRVVAVRQQNEIKEKFHDMKIGDCRQLSERYYLMRVK